MRISVTDRTTFSRMSALCAPRIEVIQRTRIRSDTRLRQNGEWFLPGRSARERPREQPQ